MSKNAASSKVKSKKQAPALSSAELDRLGHALLTLANETWVLHDRQRVLESRLQELGLDLQIDSYSPPLELQALLDGEREAFVQNLLNTLAGESPSTGSDE